MAKTAASPTITKRERTRVLAYLDRLEQAREQGHNILIQRAEAIIFQKTTGQLAPDYFNNSGFESAVKNLKAAAEDLDNLAHLWRPFITDVDHEKDWARFGEICFYHDAQRAVQDDKRTAKTWTNESWQAEVIEPMKQHHADILAHVQALRGRLCGTAAKDDPGRPCLYPKSVAYGVKQRQREHPDNWKDIYAECKRLCQTVKAWKAEKLPSNLDAYKAAVRRALRN